MSNDNFYSFKGSMVKLPLEIGLSSILVILSTQMVPVTISFLIPLCFSHSGIFKLFLLDMNSNSLPHSGIDEGLITVKMFGTSFKKSTVVFENL